MIRIVLPSRRHVLVSALGVTYAYGAREVSYTEDGSGYNWVSMCGVRYSVLEPSSTCGGEGRPPWSLGGFAATASAPAAPAVH